MRNILKLTLTVLVLFAAVAASAQRKITGVVVSAADSVAAPGATVACMVGGKQTAATVTDADGAFAISTDGSEDCRLRVSSVGFEAYSISIPKSKKGTVALGHIYLTPAVGELEGVTVRADRERIDRSLVFPTENDVKVSTDIFSFLRTLNLRGMDIDEVSKSASIRGKSPQWKINGVPKTLSDIKNIKPKDVLRIEYSDVPSMREIDRGYGGVVNFVLKERTDGGTASANAESALTTGFVNAGATVGYNKGNSSLTLDYNMSHRKYNEWKRDEQADYVSPTDTINRDMRGLDSDFGYTDHNLTLNYTLQKGWKTQFSASFRNNIYTKDAMPGSVYGDDILRRIHSTWDSYTPSLDLYFNHYFTGVDIIELNVVGTMMNNGRSRYTLTDTYADGTTDEYATPADSKRKSLISEAYYTHFFKGGQAISAGVQNTVAGSRNHYLNTGLRDRLDENNTYVFVQSWGSIGKKVQYSVGTGLKYYHTDNGMMERDFWRNQTTLSLSYSPTRNIFLRYNMYYYPTLPGLSCMTSVSQRIDDLQTLQGNPYLESAQNVWNSLMLYCEKGIFSSNLTVSFSHTSDPIYLAMGYDGTSGLFTNSYINGKYNKQLNIDWSPKLQGLFGFMNIRGGVGFNRYWAKADVFSHTLNNFYWSLGVDLYYKQFTLTGFYKKPQKTLYNETVSRGETMSYVRLNWKNKKNNIQVYAMILNPFTTDGCTYLNESLSRYKPGSSLVTIADNGNMVYLGCRFDFSFGKKFNKGGRSLNNADSGSSILKVEQ